ncbi:hypothetical protein [Nonomuraea jabiensis]|uniref:MFS family permease n=1 Tax=Nonomuraea jabiensis TaxID=882448 RepID=A0A7W9GCU4_9ACTN|nr:hypothetical protein [Nonomuraea jabiensis]MBB5781432.1 MFS family permease [Nonomuraea jabiensis]
MTLHRLSTAVELLRTNGRYRRYALARLTSTTGTTVAPLGLAFAVIQSGGGPAALGFVLMGGLLVFLAVTPVAGVVADRLPRLSVIVACQLVCGVSQFVAPGQGLVTSAIGVGLACGSITSLLFPPGRVGLLSCVTPIPEALLLVSMASNAPLPVLAGAAVLTGAAGTLQLIAWTSHLQEVIPAEQLSRIVATNAMIGTLLVPVAYSVAGPLADLVGVRAVLAECAAIVLGGAAAAACVREVRHVNARVG